MASCSYIVVYVYGEVQLLGDCLLPLSCMLRNYNDTVAKPFFLIFQVQLLYHFTNLCFSFFRGR